MLAGLWRAVLFGLMLCLLPAPGVQAAEPGANDVERGVKAAFLYKFLGYVEFPAAGDAAGSPPLVVGVVGADGLAGELVRITAGRTVNNRAIQIRVVRDGDALAGIQLLFVGSAVASRTAALLHAAQQAGVLGVTEIDNGLQLGSVINFRLVEQRVRFEVSLEAAEKSNLKLSSRLLSVAYTVQKAGT